MIDLSDKDIYTLIKKNNDILENDENIENVTIERVDDNIKRNNYVYKILAILAIMFILYVIYRANKN